LISHESNPTEGINWALFCDTDRSLYLRCSRPLCSSQNTGGIPRAWLLPVNKRIQRLGAIRR